MEAIRSVVLNNRLLRPTRPGLAKVEECRCKRRRTNQVAAIGRAFVLFFRRLRLLLFRRLFFFSFLFVFFLVFGFCFGSRVKNYRRIDPTADAGGGGGGEAHSFVLLLFIKIISVFPLFPLFIIGPVSHPSSLFDWKSLALAGDEIFLFLFLFWKTKGNLQDAVEKENNVEDEIKGRYWSIQDGEMASFYRFKTR